MDKPPPAPSLSSLAPARTSRLEELDVPVRSFDVDTLLVELGPSDDDGGTETQICRSVEDFYAPAARFALQEALADFLENEEITATELLHRADAQQRLQAWPQYCAVIDSVAAAQASPGRWTAGMRSDELRGLAAEIVALTKECAHKGPPPGVNARRLSSHVAQSTAATTPFRARFAVDAALAAWLAPAVTYHDKLMLLLALDSDDLSPQAAEMVDQIVGEILVARRGRAQALTGVRGLGPQLNALAELWRGDLPTDNGASSLFRRLCGLSVRLIAGRARAGVEHAIHALLAGEERFCPPANSFDARKIALVIDEFKAGAEALENLTFMGRVIGGERTQFMLDHRLGDLVAGDNLEFLLRGKSHQARILDLLTLEASATGEYCRTTLNEAITRHFETRDFVQRVFEMTRAAGARLKVLSELHHALAASGVPEPAKARNLRMLDEVQCTFMRTNRVLARIAIEGAAAVSDVIEFMGLLADGVFIEGKSSGVVRAAVEKHLRHPSFVRAFVNQELRPGEKRTDKFGGFFALAQAAGLNVKRPADVRILLADDERQAREYVSMVLNDIGVRQVTHASDGREAMEAYTQSPDAFDLIICDWRMPRLSGLEVLKYVRAMRPQQPFLMATALSTLVAVEEALAHDVTAYVAKPFTPEQLEAKVVVLLNRPIAAEKSEITS